MNKVQTNKLNMYGTVQTTMEENKSVWSTVPIMQSIVQEFNQILGQIRSAGAKRAVSNVGITQEKNAKKEAMAGKAYQIASIAYAYADISKNLSLKAGLNHAYSKILGEKDNQAINICNSIYEQVQVIQTELSDYGLGVNDLSELQSLIADFQSSIGGKGNVKSSAVAVTKSLAELFKDADNLLKERIDRLLTRFKDSHPDF